MEVYLIRHTRVKPGKEVCYGQSDVEVGDSFAQEAESYRMRLPEKFDQVYSSSLNRCRVLAESLNLGPLQTDDRLREASFGQWEGKRWQDIPREQLDPWMNDFVNNSPPGGESLKQVFTRFSAFIDELSRQNHESILVVAHAGIIRCAWAYILELDLKNIFKIPVDFGEILVFNLGSNISECFIKQKN